MIHRYYGLFCFSVLFVAIPTVYSCSEHNVIDAIFQNYNSRVRPVLQQNITLDIQYELRVYSIMSIDEPEEIIDLLLWTVLLWHDQFLTWNPEDFDGCTSIKVAADQIWSPDVYFINTLDVASISPTVAQYVSIFYNGSIRRALKYKAHLGCSMEINDFPFDTQNCPITVGLWTYNYSEAILNLRYPIVGLASYNGDPDFAPVMSNASEFEIVSYTGAEIMTTVGSQNYSELHYTIGLKRRPAYYVFVILIPSYMLTSLCIIGIFTPNSNINERNEKVSLGLMTLMSMTVILNIVADQMPKGSKGLPLLGIFVLYEIGICAIAIILSVIIIIIHQRSLSRGWKPPALCLWICRARVSKTAREVSPAIVKRYLSIGYERGSLEDNINCIMEKNFEQLAKILQSICSMFHNAIESMEKRIQEDEEKEYRELIWQKFCDTLDSFLLVLLLLLNTIISYFLLR